MDEKKTRWIVTVLLGAVISVVSYFGFFYYRDNLATHYPMKVVSSDAFRSGSIPFWNPSVGGGQPLAGNPNTLTFYPDNLLYLFLPAQTAFNLHFLLHLLVGLFALRSLARRYGASEEGANAGAVIYAASGATVSLLTFYNLSTAIALLPLALLAAEQLIERVCFATILRLGAVLGLIGLAGEPFTVFGAAVLLVIVTIGRISKRAIAAATASVAIAITAVLPLAVSYSEIAGETERSAHPYSARTLLAASLEPRRLLEAIVGPIFGFGSVLRGGSTSPHLLPTVFVGIVALLAFFSARAAIATRLRIAVVGFALLALGRFDPIVSAIAGRWHASIPGRYPEKFWIEANLALVILIALWLSQSVVSRFERVIAIAGIVVAVAVAVLGLAVRGFTISPSATLLCAAVAIATCAIALVRTRGEAAQSGLIALAVAAPFLAGVIELPIDWFEPYRVPAAAGALMPGETIWREPSVESFVLHDRSPRSEYRLRATMLEPTFGASVGIRYALDRSPEGMYSLLSRIALERVQSVDPAKKLAYLRAAGVWHVVTRNRWPDGIASTDSVLSIDGNRLHFYAIGGRRISTPQHLIGTSTIQQAVATMESSGFDPGVSAVVPTRWAAVTGVARVLRLVENGDTIHVTVETSAPAIVVVSQSYFSAWRAEAGGKELATFPANLDRLAFVAPPGRSDVTLTFGRHRALVSALSIVSLLIILAAGASVLIRGRRVPRTLSA